MKDINYKYLLITLAVVLIAFLSCSLLWLYPDKGVGPNMMTAFLGVFLSALVTLLLLRGQTKAEEVKDRNSQVFKEKLKIYQDFLETLNSVLEDGVVTPEEALKLKFKISMMALHTDSQRINEISKSIKEIFLAVNDRPGKLEIETVQLKELFHIVNQFGQEIYGESKGNLGEALENFKVIDDSYRTDTRPMMLTNESVGSRDELIELVQKSGWIVTDDNDHPIIIEKPNIRIKLERDDRWYFSIALSEPTYDSRNRREIYKALRRKFGGAYNSNAPWGWYVYLNDEYAAMNQAQFDDSLTNNADFRQYLFGNLMKFVGYMDKINVLVCLILPKLKKTSDKWDTNLYLYEDLFCVAIDFGEDDGHPFIDVGIDDGMYYTKMSLRNRGEEEFRNYLKSIGLGTEASVVKDDKYLDISAEINDTIDCANDLIARIEQADS